jgi:peptidyl-prolyl cis-trans isomerase SurA
MKVRLSLVLLLALAAVPIRAEILERIIVKVNGDIFTLRDLEQRQVSILGSRKNLQANPDSLKNDEETKKALAEITPQLLVDVIDELLLVQLGKEKGYRLSDEQFKSWMDNLRKEQNLQDEAKFLAALQQEGMTIADLRKNVERSFMINQVQREEVGSKLSITEEEARQYYLGHKEEFAEPATATLREILIEVPAAAQKGQAGVNVGKDDEAAAQAAAVRARLTAGEDFAKLAAEVSAAASKANGGLIGPINVAELSPALQQTLAKMKPGEVTAPIRTPRGYQILKLETMKTAAIQPFETVRDLVVDKLHEARQETEVRKFLARIRRQAIIEWKDPALKNAYEKQVAIADSTGTGGH